MKRFIYAAVSLMGVILIFCLLYNNYNQKNIEYITKSEMVEDLKFLEESLLKNHPKLNIEYEKVQFRNCISRLINGLDNEEDINDFYFTVSKALAYLNDGHTSIDYSQEKDEYFNFNIVWIDDEIYINENVGELETGDKILSIGGCTSKDLLEKFDVFIPHDNNGWLKYRIEQLLPQRRYLEYLDILDDKNGINVQISKADNETKDVNIKLEQYYFNHINSRLDNTYEINKQYNTAIMYLNYLDYDEKTKKFLRSFFTEVKTMECQH